MKYRILFLSLVMFIPFGVKAETFVPASGEFEAAIVMQPKSGNVIYAYNPEKPHVAASLTKLLTGLTVLELHPNWDKVVSIESEDEVGGGRLRVEMGSQMTLRDLFYSSITASANNAAMALSRVSGVSRTDFVARMNTIADRVGTKNTHVYEASGMEVNNMTTAYDMAKITEAAFSNDIMTRAATVSSYKFPILNTGETKIIKSTNSPFLLDDDVWLLGGKTGFLYESRYNLTAKLQPYVNGVHDSKYEVIVVVMGAPTKQGSFDSVKRLAQWAWQNPEKFVSPVVPEDMITRQLTYGMTAQDVKTLQTWLSLDKEVYPEGITSGFFGPLTLQAVQRFQLKYHVVDSPSSQGYGVVGPATRAELLEFYLDHNLELNALQAASSGEENDLRVSTRGIQSVLVYGNVSDEVTLLQQWLSSDKTVYPEGIVSGYFGPLTLGAVQNFN